MTTITDEMMRQMLPLAKYYTLVILKSGPRRREAGIEKTVWEHGRRNFELRADGLLSIVCPVPEDGGNVHGIGIFNASVEEVRKILEDDPGVKAGIFVYEVHNCRGFPAIACPSFCETLAFEPNLSHRIRGKSHARTSCD